MDPTRTSTTAVSSATATQATTRPTTAPTKHHRLPTSVFVIIPFAILIFLAFVSLAIFLLCRRHKKRKQATASNDPETTQIRGGQRQQHRRWPWRISGMTIRSNGGSGGGAHGGGGVVRRESTEGLNELGEAPPPYHARGLAVESVEDCTIVQPVEEFGNGDGIGIARPMSVVLAGSWPPTYEPGAIGLAISGPSPAPPRYDGEP